MMTDRPDRRAVRLGIFAMVGCCVIWGLSPLYYGLLSHIPPAEILAHRTIWSLMFFLGILFAQRRLPRLIDALSSGARVGWVLLAAAMISINWFVFIYAIQVGLVRETSLGYYIFPLFSVALGFFVLGERLRRAQVLAVGLAATALLVLTIGLGVTPWISLILGSTFSLYGLIKNRVEAGAVVSVTAEVALLAPIAVAFLVYAGSVPGFWSGALLILSGPLTAVPLMLFSYAAKRIRLSTVGIVQYLNPSLQFALAALVLAEPISVPHLIAFPLVWIALALYSMSSLREEREARSASAKASTVGTGV